MNDNMKKCASFYIFTTYIVETQEILTIIAKKVYFGNIRNSNIRTSNRLHNF